MFNRLLPIISIFCIVSVLILGVTGVSFSAADVPQVQDLPDDLFVKFIEPFLVTTTGALISALCAYGVRFLSAKTGIVLSESAQAHIEHAAENAVYYVEEKATAAVKSGLNKWSGTQKILAAVEHLTANVPGITTERAEEMVHSAIARIPGLGATGFLTMPSIETATVTPQTATVAPQAATAGPQLAGDMKSAMMIMASDAVSALLQGLATSITDKATKTATTA